MVDYAYGAPDTIELKPKMTLERNAGAARQRVAIREIATAKIRDI